MKEVGVRRDERAAILTEYAGVSQRRSTRSADDNEAAVVRPPLLFCARWEKDQAGVRRPGERKGGTKLNTSIRKARSVLGLYTRVKTNPSFPGRGRPPNF